MFSLFSYTSSCREIILRFAVCCLHFGLQIYTIILVYKRMRGFFCFLEGCRVSCAVSSRFDLLVAGPAVTTQDADPFELSASCVGVVPSLAPAEFCTTSPHRRYQNIFCEWSSSPLSVLQDFRVVGHIWREKMLTVKQVFLVVAQSGRKQWYVVKAMGISMPNNGMADSGG